MCSTRHLTALFHLLVIFLLTAITPLAAKPPMVKQRVAVLTFGLRGTGDLSFLPYHIQKLFERELDRTDKINVIREYLWSNFTSGKFNPEDPVSIAQFGLQAKVECVISGTCDISSPDRAIIKYRVFDVLNNMVLEEREIIAPNNEKFFPLMETNAAGSVSKITQSFPLIDPVLAAKKRTVVKKINIISSQKNSGFSLQAGAILANSYLNTPEMKLMNGNRVYQSYVSPTNEIMYRIAAGLRVKRFSTLADFNIINDKHLKAIRTGLQLEYWLVPDTVALFLKPCYMSAAYSMTVQDALVLTTYYKTEVQFSSFLLMFGCRFKANQVMSFGAIASLPVLFFAKCTMDGIAIQASTVLMNAELFWEFMVTKELGFQIQILTQDVSLWSEINQRFSPGFGYFSLGANLTYKFEWNPKK